MSSTTANFSLLLDEVVSAIAFETMYQGTYMMPLIYGVRGSTRARERLGSVGGIADFEALTETQGLPEDAASQQFSKDFVHVEYGKKLAVSRKLVDDDEYGLLADYGQKLGEAAGRTMEKLAAALFADMFTGATYTSEDDKSICNGAHTNKAGGNSQDNSHTASLSFAGIKTLRQAFRRVKDYRGEILGLQPDAIICAIEGEEDGWEAVNSTGKPDTANNNENVYKGSFELMVWPALDDTNAWFMVQKSLMKQNLLWFQRIALEIMSAGSFEDRTKSIGGYWRASHGCRDWRFVQGSNPS